MTLDELEQHRTARHHYNMLDERVENRRTRQLEKLYGISLDEYQELWDKQNGCCAICEMPETLRTNRTGKLRFLAVDHNHETRKIRGLLCNNCNVAISRVPWFIKYQREINNYLGEEFVSSSSTDDFDEVDTDDEG